MIIKRFTLVAVCILIQNTFGDEILVPENTNTTIPNEYHDVLQNKTDTLTNIENVTNIQYVYPNNNYRKEISPSNNRSERYLYIGMEDADDAVLVFPSIVYDTKKEKNNAIEKSVTLFETEDGFINDTVSKEVKLTNVSFENHLKSNSTTTEIPELKAKSLLNGETKSSKLRERLANLSKLRSKIHKNKKLRLAQSSIKLPLFLNNMTVTESTNLSKNKSVSQNITDKLLPTTLKFFRVENSTVDILNLTNVNKTIDVAQLETNTTTSKNKNLNISSDSISNTSFVNPISKNTTEDRKFLMTELKALGAEKVNNSGNVKGGMSQLSLEDLPTSKEKDSKHEMPGFNVEMIPFTIDDVMVASGSETKSYWTIPNSVEIKNTEEMEEMVPQLKAPSREMIRNMIKDQVVDARKRMKKFSSTQKGKKVLKSEKKNVDSENFVRNNLATNGGEKSEISTLIKDTPYTDQTIGTRNIFDQETHLNNAKFSSASRQIYPNAYSTLQEPSLSMYAFVADTTLDGLMFDESAKEMPWYNLKDYMPTQQLEPTRIGDLLIVGPIPKSLPQQFKYEPFHYQMQLPQT